MRADLDGRALARQHCIETVPKSYDFKWVQ
jgi:hypothetical protein